LEEGTRTEGEGGSLEIKVDRDIEGIKENKTIV